NFSALKTEYAQDMGSIIPKIKQLPAQETAVKLENGGTVEIELENDSLYLDRGYFLLEREDKENYSTTIERDYSVAIDTRISDDLKKEGIVRDLVRYVQIMRKDAGFQVEDRIEISGDFSDETIDAIDENLNYLKTETLATKLHKEKREGDLEKEIKLDGNKEVVTVKRINK
ncbi:MAG TPA: DUF5915 domain-containing protein, partial [bacterium]|nr:DUF5915 domain-containing protein [bacterium]